MRHLIDSNIFLEILLQQGAKERCKQFLQDHNTGCCLTDFSLHTIGVLLFYHDQEKVYGDFLQDVLPQLELLHLPKSEYEKIAVVHAKYNLDFDDAYQFVNAQHYNLELVTMDKDFRHVKDAARIKFI